MQQGLREILEVKEAHVTTVRKCPRRLIELTQQCSRQRKLIAASVKKVPAPPSAPAVMQRPINSGVDVVLKYWVR